MRSDQTRRSSFFIQTELRCRRGNPRLCIRAPVFAGTRRSIQVDTLILSVSFENPGAKDRSGADKLTPSNPRHRQSKNLRLVPGLQTPQGGKPTRLQPPTPIANPLVRCDRLNPRHAPAQPLQQVLFTGIRGPLYGRLLLGRALTNSERQSAHLPPRSGGRSAWLPAVCHRGF